MSTVVIKSSDRFEEIMEISTEDRRIESKLLAPILYYLILTEFCVFGREMVVSFLNIPNILFQLTRFGIPLILFCRAFRFLSARSKLWFLIFEILFLGSYMFSYLQGYMLREYILEYVVTTCCICIPFFALSLNLKDSELINNKLLITANICSVVMCLYLIVTIGSVRYSLNGTYQLLFCSTIHTNEIFRRKRRRTWLLLWLAFELFLIFVRGSRGPLVCYAIFLMIRTVLSERERKRLFFFLIACSFGFGVVGIFADRIIMQLSYLLGRMNLSSRSLLVIMDSAFWDDSGRGYFKDLIRDFIRQRPIIGYGASSDIMLADGYPHSIFLELMFDFGMPVGIIIIIAFLKSAYNIFRYEDKLYRDAALIFFISGFVMLLISGTYLQNIYVFVMLGMGFNENISRERKIRFSI